MLHYQIKPYFCTHEKETIIHRGSVGCLLRTRSNRHHLAPALPQETDTEPGEKPTGSPSKPQPADTLKKKPVKKMDFNISGTLRDKEGKGVAGVIVSEWIQLCKNRCTGQI